MAEIQAGEWERLPCGCQIGTTVIDGANTFMIEPHALDCPAYLFVLEETARQGKTTTTIDLR